MTTKDESATSNAWTQGYACAVAALIRMDNGPDFSKGDINVPTDAGGLLRAGPVLEELQAAEVDEYDMEVLKPACISLGHTRYQKPDFQLPAIKRQPCHECPWRTDSAPGHLGGFTAEQWIDVVNSDEPIACHLTLKNDMGWQSPGVRQCRGAAMFRRKICKLPRNKTDAAHKVLPDVETIFQNAKEFEAHHEDL